MFLSFRQRNTLGREKVYHAPYLVCLTDYRRIDPSPRRAKIVRKTTKSRLYAVEIFHAAENCLVEVVQLESKHLLQRASFPSRP